MGSLATISHQGDVHKRLSIFSSGDVHQLGFVQITPFGIGAASSWTTDRRRCALGDSCWWCVHAATDYESVQHWDDPRHQLQVFPSSVVNTTDMVLDPSSICYATLLPPTCLLSLLFHLPPDLCARLSASSLPSADMATFTETQSIWRQTNTDTNGELAKNPAPREPGLPSDGAKVQAHKFPRPAQFADPYEARKHLKRRLALAFRIFGKFGFDEGVAGHITVRDPVDPSTFWVNPFGVPFEMITTRDLILVNHHGEVIGGGPNGDGGLLNTAAFMIHSAIHEARPDVQCAAHSHSVYGRAFTTLGRELDIITQDSCQFYNDHVVYQQFNGIVLAVEEGKNIAKALGNKKAALLQNHGLLTVGSTIESAVYAFTSLETCCRAQLMADAAATGRGGTTVKVDDADAAYTYKAVGTQPAMWFSGLPLFKVMENQLKGDKWDYEE